MRLRSAFAAVCLLFLAAPPSAAEERITRFTSDVQIRPDAALDVTETIDVVAEQNQGGRMVQAILHAADPRLRVRLVSARTGKSARAEPVAHLFEAARAWLHGRMPELEAQLLGMIAGGGYDGPGTSPDRADAMVWGISELMRERAEPRVRSL